MIHRHDRRNGRQGQAVTTGRPTGDDARDGPPHPPYAGKVWSRRAVIDYSLARRATLTGLNGGGSSHDEACDAHPYLEDDD